MASSCRRRHHSLIPWFPERLRYCELLSGVEEITRKKIFISCSFIEFRCWTNTVEKRWKRRKQKNIFCSLTTHVKLLGKLCRLSGFWDEQVGREVNNCSRRWCSRTGHFCSITLKTCDITSKLKVCKCSGVKTDSLTPGNFSFQFKAVTIENFRDTMLLPTRKQT